jgi:pyruvate formate lyase activating enzyme
LDRLLPYSAMVLYDMKLIDPEAHKKFTGFSNERILENLIYVADYMGSHVYPRQLWIRTPIIPDATAFNENIAGIGQWIAGHLKDGVNRWELCAFNNLCRDKYLRLDQKWVYHDAPLLSTEFMEELTETARCSGIDPEIVVWSGSTRIQQKAITN